MMNKIFFTLLVCTTAVRGTQTEAYMTTDPASNNGTDEPVTIEASTAYRNEYPPSSNRPKAYMTTDPASNNGTDEPVTIEASTAYGNEYPPSSNRPKDPATTTRTIQQEESTTSAVYELENMTFEERFMKVTTRPSFGDVSPHGAADVSGDLPDGQCYECSSHIDDNCVGQPSTYGACDGGLCFVMQSTCLIQELKHKVQRSVYRYICKGQTQEDAYPDYEFTGESGYIFTRGCASHCPVVKDVDYEPLTTVRCASANKPSGAEQPSINLFLYAILAIHFML